MSTASPAFAAPKANPLKQGIVYTALGDSIAYGTGATDQYGYTDMLNEHLTRINGTGQYFNLSADGVTSSMLSTALYNSYQVQGAVAAADVITISIGGNDLLGLFLSGFGQLIVDNYSIPVEPFVNFNQLMMDLKGWQANPYDPEYSHFNQLLIDLAGQFPSAVGGFNYNWLEIIGRIIELNPDADIYVNTVYNPFVNIPILHDAIDPFIQALNVAIEDYADDFDYKVVDVYSAFQGYRNPKKLAVGDLSNLVEFIMDPTTVPVPLHPTDLGYKFIFNMHKDLMD